MLTLIRRIVTPRICETREAYLVRRIAEVRIELENLSIEHAIRRDLGGTDDFVTRTTSELASRRRAIGPAVRGSYAAHLAQFPELGETGG